MANDDKKKKGFFGIFKKKETTQQPEPIVSEQKVEEYKGIPAEFLVSRNMENTTGLPKIDALGSYDEPLEDLSTVSSNSSPTDINNVIETMQQEQNNVSPEGATTQEQTPAPKLVTPDEPIFVDNSNVSEQVQNLNEQPVKEEQVLPQFGDFIQKNEIKEGNVSSYVNELYNEQVSRNSENSGGISR